MVHSNVRVKKTIIWQMSATNQDFLYNRGITPQFIKLGSRHLNNHYKTKTTKWTQIISLRDSNCHLPDTDRQDVIKGDTVSLNKVWGWLGASPNCYCPSMPLTMKEAQQSWVETQISA